MGEIWGNLVLYEAVGVMFVMGRKQLIAFPKHGTTIN